MTHAAFKSCSQNSRDTQTWQRRAGEGSDRTRCAGELQRMGWVVILRHCLVFGDTGNHLSCLCSFRSWRRTNGSCEPSETGRRGETCSVRWIVSSFRWSTTTPWGKTWRTRRAAGASISSRRSRWRAETSSGRACPGSGCPCCTAAVRTASIRGRARKNRRPTLRKRTSPKPRRDLVRCRRTSRKRQKKDQSWRGNRRISQVRWAGPKVGILKQSVENNVLNHNTVTSW